MKNKRINAKSLFKGVLSSSFGAMKLSLVVAMISFIISALQGRPFDKVIAEFLITLWVFSIMTGVIAFLTAIIIGIPVVAILLSFQLDDELITAVIAAMFMFLFVILGSRLSVYHILFISYSFYCGWCFMKGYKRSLS